MSRKTSTFDLPTTFHVRRLARSDVLSDNCRLHWPAGRSNVALDTYHPGGRARTTSSNNPDIVERLGSLLGEGEWFGVDLRIRDYLREEFNAERLERVQRQMPSAGRVSEVPVRYLNVDLASCGAARRSLGEAPPLPWPEVFWRAIEHTAGYLFLPREEVPEDHFESAHEKTALELAELVLFDGEWDSQRWSYLEMADDVLNGQWRLGRASTSVSSR